MTAPPSNDEKAVWAPPRAEPPGAPRWLGGLSCAVFVLVVLVFLFFWRKVGIPPVARGTMTLSSHTSFLMLWTRVFDIAAVLGVVLGAMGVRRQRRLGGLALMGLVLNGLLLAALVVAQSTGQG